MDIFARHLMNDENINLRYNTYAKPYILRDFSGWVFKKQVK